MDKRKCLFIILILVPAFSLMAQPDFSAKTRRFIDSSIAQKTNLEDLQKLIKDLDVKAIEAQQYFFAARCLNYQLQITDLKTEDTLYFKNSAFIDDMLLQKQQPNSILYALYLMKAARLINFDIRYNRFQRSRYERKDIPVNYAAYTKIQLDSIAQLSFQQAKNISKLISWEQIDEALWLSSDPLQFLYKPDFFDLAIAEQLKTVREKYFFRLPEKYFIEKWLYVTPEVFAGKLDSVYRSDGTTFRDLKLYGEWIDHSRTNLSAYYFIESVARKYVYELVKQDSPETENIYEGYLLQSSRSSYNTVRAYAVYQLCLLWNSQASKYFPEAETRYDYTIKNYRSKQDDFDTVYRYHAVKALQLFEKNKDLLDSFSYLKNILSGMEAKIRRNELIISMPEYNLPQVPVLVELKFKNADSIYYRVVQTRPEYSYRNNDQLVAELLKIPVLKEQAFLLPAANDFNYHNVYLKLGAMPPGSYALIFSHQPLMDTLFKKEYFFFNVTNISVVNNDKRVYVLNRKTGKPLTGAKVNAWYREKINKAGSTGSDIHAKNYKVNSRGFIEIENSNYTNIKVNYKDDSIADVINVKHKSREDDVYSADQYDDLIDFYEENATAYIFTDRSIYRPGQTVFYKAIFITKNKKTSEPMLMNKRNLKGKVFGNVFSKWLKDEDPLLVISDPFNKQMDSVKIIPNEFGSVCGSFKIPKTAATGEWEIEPDYIHKDWKNGKFKVEEYKRPSYEITVDKPKKELKPKDEFIFKVKVKSFAGATLDNVKIKYTIERNGDVPEYDSLQKKIVRRNSNETISDTSAFTNKEGELEISVRDTLFFNYNADKNEEWNFNYNLDAEAIDATGESYETNASVLISSRPVSIKIPLAVKYNRNDLNIVSVSAKDNNAGVVSKEIQIKVYRIAGDAKVFNDRKFTKADLWLYDEQTLQQEFPYDNLLPIEKKESRELVLEKIINTTNQGKLELNKDIFTPGRYLLEAECEENGMMTGMLKKNFEVFDSKESKLPQEAWSFYYLPYNTVLPGDHLTYYYGNSQDETYSIFHIAYFAGKRKAGVKYFYNEQQDEKGLHQFDFKVPHESIDRMKLTQVYVLHNRVFTHSEDIYINRKSTDEPEIVIEKYRKKLLPGSKETFTVSIKTKNGDVAAELMTTMYDAALDKLEEHTWNKPFNGFNNRYLDVEWTTHINSTVRNSVENIFYIRSDKDKKISQNPLWWTNPLDYADDVIMGDWNFKERRRLNDGLDLDNFSPGAGNGLAGKVAGITITSTQGLNEVIVIGYGTVKRKDLTGSVSAMMMIRGNSSLSSYNQPLIILDGVPYTGDISKIDPKTITNAIVLKGADASAIYGAHAAEGVLILSTKGEIVFPAEPAPVIIPRKNFDETAFFFPAVHADKDGLYSFSFTMPESVTEWNWKMLAQTKKSFFAYAERKLSTQLPLMVQPNMPRLLYQGDQLVLQSRISNLDTINATGKIVCKIEDAVTGDDITSQLVSVAQNNFTVIKKGNISSAFDIKIPEKQLNPLKIIITVRSESFADGEEHLIPVLSPKVFIKDSNPYYFSKQNDTTIRLPALPADAELYGVGLSIQPKPQAALINSLPYLANYPYGCAEQTFNKLLAYITAYKMMRSDTAIQESFNKAQQFVEKENSAIEKLPGELNGETMPWLNLSNKTGMQQNQLFNLLDTLKSGLIIKELLEKLYQFQNAEGGISWFNGGKSDFYISNYVLRGFGELLKDGRMLPQHLFGSQYDVFIEKLISYCDQVFLKAVNEGQTANTFYYAYARSYWVDRYLLNDSSKQKIMRHLEEQWKSAGNKSLYNQSLLIISSLRYAAVEKDELYGKAIVLLKSIREMAIDDEQNGIRWKELADKDDLTNSSEETIALLAEAFGEYKKDNEVNKGVIRWLLTAKEEHSWKSTKATAAAISLLSNNRKAITGETQTIHLSLDNRNVFVSDDLLNDAGFVFSKSSLIPSAIQLQKDNIGTAAGYFYRYYFTSSGNLNELNKDVQLKKRFYKWNESENRWDIFTDGTILKIADKVKVVVTVQSSKALQYVFIDDKRAAAFEPLDNNSGYEYNSGVSFYKSVRDAGFQFFVSYIPSGKHEISYELKVAYEGSFLNGPAVLQCMYKPEIAAYSNSIFIKSEK